MRIGRALVVHRDVEEPGRAEGLAGRSDFLQMATDRLLPLVEAEHRLERGGRGQGSRLVTDERVVQAMTNRPLERLMKNATLTHRVDLAELGVEIRDVPGGPLSDDRGVEAAELRDVKERPARARGP
jgi:hypothetical protein